MIETETSSFSNSILNNERDPIIDKSSSDLLTFMEGDHARMPIGRQSPEPDDSIIVIAKGTASAHAFKQLMMLKEEGVKSNFTCDTCGKHFNSQSRWREHLVVHSEERPFKCRFCGQGFKRFRDATRHERIHLHELHSNPASSSYAKTMKALVSRARKTVRCTVCSKAFVNKLHLLKHTRAIHENIRPFSCPTCGKKFAEKGRCGEHLLTHTDTRPYTCLLCGNAFKRSRDCTRHSKLVHGWSTNDTFVCVECGKLFIEKKEFEIHHRSHLDDIVNEEVAMFYELDDEKNDRTENEVFVSNCEASSTTVTLSEQPVSGTVTLE